MKSALLVLVLPEGESDRQGWRDCANEMQRIARNAPGAEMLCEGTWQFSMDKGLQAFVRTAFEASKSGFEYRVLFFDDENGWAISRPKANASMGFVVSRPSN